MFKEPESKIIKSCIRLSSVKAKEIMTPSIVVEAVNQELTFKEFYGIQEWRFSIVTDENGRMKGVITMEDIIETMTGVEIVDEDDIVVDMQALAEEKSKTSCP